MATASYYLQPASVMCEAWKIASAGAARFGGSVRLYIAEAMRQAWALMKALAAREAARTARLFASARLDVAFADLERERLERQAGRTVIYSFARGYGRGAIAGGRW